ncbi:MAG: hypothetical protein ACE5HV_06100 [Acidobacteriota bacterium]
MPEQLRRYLSAVITLTVILVCFAPTPAVAQQSEPRYSIGARFDIGARTIGGTVRVELTNTSTAAITSIPVVLYPNFYAHPDKKHLNELNWPWVYIGSFNPGRMRLRAARIEGQAVEPQTDNTVGVPADTLARLSLPSALQPGEKITLELEFDVLVPKKFGDFGFYRQTLTANGGWYPYVSGLHADGSWALHAPPPRARFDVDLELTEARDTFLNNRYFPQTDRLSVRGVQGQFLTLVSTPRYHLVERQANGGVVRFYEFKPGRYAEASVAETLRDFIDQAEAAVDVRPASGEAIIVETYMRRNVARPGEGIILLSDEGFKAVKNFGFRDLNRLALVRAYAYQRVRDRVYEKEALEDVNWVAESLAWSITEGYRRTGFRDVADLVATASRFGMFRPFNRMAIAPTIPFTSAYNRNVATEDPFRESLFFFNNELPAGRLIYLKLKDEVEEETAERILGNYLAADRPFRQVASEVSGEQLDWFFDQWLQAFPDSIQYRLVEVDRNQPAGGRNRTTIELERLSSRPIIERVPIALDLENGEQQTIWWDGRQDRGSLTADTDQRVKRVVIDPFGETFDNVQVDNRSPKPWEMIIDRGEVFVNTAGIGAASRFRFRPKDDFSDEVFVQPFFSPGQVGISGGYFHNFGRSRDPWFFRKTQQINFLYGLSNLRSGFADEKSGEEDGDGQIGFVQVQYSFDDQVFEEDPQARKGFKVNLQVARTELGGDFNFYKTWAIGSVVRSITPNHKVAFQAVLGHGDGFRSQDRIPAQAMFDAVAFNRGLSFGDAIGRNIGNLRGEWRFDLFKDIDKAMPLMWFRRIQVNIGMDASWVSDHFDELFTLDDTRLALVMGMRMHYDFFGIRPSDLTFDFGREVGHGNRSKSYIINLGILQTF